MNATPTLCNVNKSTFSHSLLDHDGLMTPVLIAQFGRLTVIQTGFHHSADRFLRRSSIYQAASGAKILDAVLDISLLALPLGFFEKLQHQGNLFGQLLNDFSIPVRIAARSLHHAAGQGDEGTRWGRRLTMYRSDTQEFVSHVEELMVPEHDLLPLRLEL